MVCWLLEPMQTAIGHRQAVAHGAEAGGVEDALAGAGGAGEQEDLDAGAGGAGDELVFGLGFGADDLGEVEDGDQAFGLAVLVGDDVVAGLPLGGALVPVGPAAVVDAFEGLELAQEFVEEGAGVGDYGLLKVWVELLKLGGVDVDGDLVGFAGEVLRGVAGEGHVETRTEDEEEVAVLEGEVGSAGGDVAGAADEGGDVRGNEVGGAPGGDGGDVEQQAQLGELLFGAGEAGAVADEEQRARGALELLDDAADLVLEVLVGLGGLDTGSGRSCGAFRGQGSGRPGRRAGCRSRRGRGGR